MISTLDIYRAANFLLRQHGADAEFIAAPRADEMLDRGDRDGESWFSVNLPRLILPISLAQFSLKDFTGGVAR